MWVENVGIVGRGVLLDCATWAETQGEPVNCFQKQVISLSALQGVVSSQGISFQPGDILFTRTGWPLAYERPTPLEYQQLADCLKPQTIGIEHRCIHSACSRLEKHLYLLKFESLPDNKLRPAILEAFLLSLDIIEHKYGFARKFTI